MSPRPCFLLWLVVFIFPAYALAQLRPLSESLPPAHPARERAYHVHHYKLTLALDLERKRCTGEAAITLNPLRPGFDRLLLDAADMQIKEARLGNRTLPFHIAGDTLAVTLDRPYAEQESLTVDIAYEVTAPIKGMYFVTPDSGYPLRQYQVWTQGEPEDNHYWFPCYDFPNDFSTSETIVTVPESLTVISNGALAGVTTDNKLHTATYHWVERKPHVSYLISLVAGTYIEIKDSWKNVPITSYVYPHQRALAQYSFAKTADMIGYFSQLTGVPYPWEKFAQVVVQDFIFGGEENVTAVTLNDNTIHDARAALDVSSDGLVAHELSHMWWGDLITCRDWSQAWLNEGFATFFANAYLEHNKGRDEAEKDIRDTQGGLLITDTGNRRRATVSDRYNAPIELFDNRIYGKGGCILTMLRHILGEEAFWKSIDRYIQAHEFGNVGTGDFEQAIRDVTGKNYDWFFNAWVYKAGVPEFNVSWQWDSTAHRAIVDVAQVQTVDSLTGVFRMPVDIELWSGGTARTSTVTIDSAKQQFTFEATVKPDLVLFDKGSVVPKRLITVKPVDEWLYQMQHAEHAVDRRIAIENLRLDTDTPRVAAAMRGVMFNDPFWANRQSAVYALDSKRIALPASDFFAAYRDSDARVRAAALSALSQYPGNPGVIRTLQTAFRIDSSYAAAAAALNALMWVDSSNAYGYCREALKRDSYRDMIRNAALNALAQISGDSAFADVMAYTRYGIDRDLRVSALWILARQWRSRPEVLDRAIALLHDPSYYVRRTAIEILGSIDSTDAIDPLRRASETEPDGRLVQLAKQTLGKLKKQ